MRDRPAGVREGAVTIIFYLGMASAIDTSQLLLLIAGSMLWNGRKAAVTTRAKSV